MCVVLPDEGIGICIGTQQGCSAGDESCYQTDPSGISYAAVIQDGDLIVIEGKDVVIRDEEDSSTNKTERC